ncbi:MAG TPA: DUF393 domain-containing protein [Oligoflexia bacterium]|nr:DUF393 domain-containing protein [Oligoflexia bacterium]HMR25702.1 DUF393 domain-containing protein [Oligoflexia bacterium]
MIKVFYDGACYVCDGEVNHYKKHKKNIAWVNIASPDFEAKQYSLNNNDLQRKLHAINSDGQVFTGIDAFVLIWKTLPKPYPYYAKVIKLPLIYSLAKIAYACFARLRVYLPKKTSCPMPQNNQSKNTLSSGNKKTW